MKKLVFILGLSLIQNINSLDKIFKPATTYVSGIGMYNEYKPVAGAHNMPILFIHPDKNDQFRDSFKHRKSQLYNITPISLSERAPYHEIKLGTDHIGYINVSALATFKKLLQSNNLDETFTPTTFYIIDTGDHPAGNYNQYNFASSDDSSMGRLLINADINKQFWPNLEHSSCLRKLICLSKRKQYSIAKNPIRTYVGESYHEIKSARSGKITHVGYVNPSGLATLKRILESRKALA